MTTQIIKNYLTEELSKIEGQRFNDAGSRKIFEKGLSILDSYPQANDFVEQTRRFRDYHRRVEILKAHLTEYINILTEAGENESMEHGNSRHVGRPTLQEAKAYREAEMSKAKAEAQSSLFPEVEPNVNLKPLTYGGIVADPDGESIAATMPNLRELRPFLSKELQERVNTVRDLRNEVSSLAEQAKAMADANEKAGSTIYTEEEIAEKATRAVNIESDILPSIYADVDREIGECYLRLSAKNGDPEYIKDIEKRCNIKPQDLRTQFKPFYEKAQARDAKFADMVAEKIANDRPEVQAERKSKADKKAKADAIIKYLQRKDKPNTAKRIKGMEIRLKELTKLIGEEDTKPYYALLEYAKEHKVESGK